MTNSIDTSAHHCKVVLVNRETPMGLDWRCHDVVHGRCDHHRRHRSTAVSLNPHLPSLPLVLQCCGASIGVCLRLHNHLRHTLATQRLATHEVLVLQSGESVEKGGESEENRGGNQTAGTRGQASPLDGAHGPVHGGAHIVARDFPDEAVELGARRANAEQERDLDEQDDEGARPKHRQVSSSSRRDQGRVARHTGR
jgi:hypothetical protein